uniref:BTB domain-containing protein n=1 Tax=Panagrolaimus sp. PS1159 TaxID=55785 RepID=A0AC35GB13_9BILA
MNAELYISGMYHKLFEDFVSQDPENGCLDVVFDIKGKKLYAHKSILSVLSDTFKTMLSDRWTKKDAPIKIESFKFDDFKEFLTFIYSGNCNLSDENIVCLTDIAEFYDIEEFKIFIDSYLSKLRLSTKNIFGMIDLSTKYAFPGFDETVNGFILQRCSTILKSPEFMCQEKHVIKHIVVAYKELLTFFEHEELFKKLCQWADTQARKKLTFDDYGKEDVKNKVIKDELADMLQHVQFNQMRHRFMLNDVVSKPFLISQPNELSQLCLVNFDTITIKVTNEYGKLATASFIDNRGIYDAIQKTKYNSTSRRRYVHSSSNGTKLDLSKPNNLIKNDKIKYYLVYENFNQVFKVKNSTTIGENDYLIAGMKNENGFAITGEMMIEALRNY